MMTANNACFRNYKAGDKFVGEVADIGYFR